VHCCAVDIRAISWIDPAGVVSIVVTRGFLGRLGCGPPRLECAWPKRALNNRDLVSRFMRQARRPNSKKRAVA